MRWKRSAARLWRAAHAFGATGGSAGTTVLVYHSVDDTGPPSVGTARFPEHLRMIVDRCRADGAGAGTPREADRPRPVVRITFDDGYRDNLLHALPALQQHGLTATVFVASGRIGTRPQRCPEGVYRGREMLSWDDLRRLRDAGLAIGSHSHEHRRLSSLSVEEIRADVRRSQAALAENLGLRAREFAYPWGGPGDLHPDAAAVLEGEGFDAAYTTIYGHLDGTADRWRLPRIVVEAEDTAEDLWAKIRGDWDYLRWYARVRHLADSLRRSLPSAWD